MFSDSNLSVPTCLECLLYNVTVRKTLQHRVSAYRDILARQAGCMEVYVRGNWKLRPALF